MLARGQSVGGERGKLPRWLKIESANKRPAAVSPLQLRVAGLAGLALGLSLAGDASLYAVLPSRPAAAGVDLAAVGLLLSLNRLVRLGFNPLSGLLYDRFGRRRLYTLALVLGTASTAMYATAPGLGPFLAARAVWGASWALILVGAYSMLMDVASPENRGLLSGTLQTAYFLGAAFGMAGAWLADAFDFRTAMFVCAGITALGVGATLGLPETHPPANRGAPPPRPAGATRSWRGLLVINVLYALGFFCANGVFYSTLGRYLNEGWGTVVTLGNLRVGVTTLTGSLLLVRSLMGLLAGPVAGRLSDRLGRWQVAAACALVSGIGFLGLASQHVLLALAGGAALLLGIPAMVAILAALTGDRSDSRGYGVAFGGLATFGAAGAAAGPLLGYALLARNVPLGCIYTGCGCALLLGAVVAWRTGARRTHSGRGHDCRRAD